MNTKSGKSKRHAGKTSPETVPTVNAAVSPGIITGKVDHVSRHFAYIVIDGREEDIRVDTEDLKGAMDGDTVIVKLLGSGSSRSGRQYAASRTGLRGRVTEVASRSRNRVVGTLERSGRQLFVKPDNRKVYDPVEVMAGNIGVGTPGVPASGVPTPGDKVVVELLTWPTQTRLATGKVTEVLGKPGEHATEMHAILAEFDLPNAFPQAVEQESEAIPEVLPAREVRRRKDFREAETFTIDPVDAKDFDDALSVRELANGHLEIGIHIADVSYYILRGGELDKEAFRRGTSVYLVDRTVPMLPEKLSNNLCSLRPYEDRLAFSAVFELTPEGKLQKEWFGRTVIHSDRRFSYEEAQEILESGVGDHAAALTRLNGLARILRDERFAKGAVNFETVEVKFRLDESGKPLGIYRKERKDAHKLVEEFMLLANRRVAEYIYGLSHKKGDNYPMVYRIHDAPDEDKLNTFAAFAARLGYSLETGSDKQTARSLNRMFEKATGTAEQNVLENLAVRTMAKARYSTEETGHFGLAFRHYTHFTSPIRRYPDLIVHRLLQHYLEEGSPADREALEEDCKHCSSRERLASEAERASIKYKQVEYMSLQDPEKVYDGIISGVTEFGFFVEITEMASEGLVRITDLHDDYYELDKENYRLIGDRTGRVFAFGEPVKVRVRETNIARRTMDFELVESGSGSEGPMRNQRGTNLRRGYRVTGRSADRRGGKKPSRSGRRR